MRLGAGEVFCEPRPPLCREKDSSSVAGSIEVLSSSLPFGLPERDSECSDADSNGGRNIMGGGLSSSKVGCGVEEEISVMVRVGEGSGIGSLRVEEVAEKGAVVCVSVGCPLKLLSPAVNYAMERSAFSRFRHINSMFRSSFSIHDLFSSNAASSSVSFLRVSLMCP